MKLWNGWGTEGTPYPLAPSAAQYLESIVGKGAPTPDARLENVVATVPPSRLAPHPLVTTDAEERVRHARGQSLPDWIALRSGQVGAFPDGVAYPVTDQDVQSLLVYARDTNTRLIPYGGGSSVVGHINVIPSDHPVLTVDLTRMAGLLELDETSQLATFGAGIRGPLLEEALNGKGYTLGHFPQSFEYSTLGGWIASRSVGTQCFYYGRIENLFVGGHVETPLGPLDLPIFPASAAGPDLRHLVLGSEGRLGMITRATVRVTPLPQKESFHAVFFPSWEDGIVALREIVQARTPVSILRLLNAQETETTLQLAGKEKLVSLAHTGLGMIGIREERCMMIFGVTGTPAKTRMAYRQASAIAHAHHGFSVNYFIGSMWHKTRFTTPYLRNTLWEKGYALDTLETALPWSKIPKAMEEIQNALRSGIQYTGEKVLVFAHLSHMYTDGASMYITYLFRRAQDPQETLQRWTTLKTAACQQIVHHGGTISHQHGVGMDHAPYLSAEKGPVGMKVLGSIFEEFDPQGFLNPGKLIIT